MSRGFILGCLVAGMLWLPASVIGQEAANPNVTIHVVQRGESLYGIALSYGLTVEELVALNGIADPSSIQVGQRLLVPASVKALPQEHVVQSGETLQSIADLYGLGLEELVANNGIEDVNTIYIGQVLTIAPDAGAAPVSPTSGQVVEPGTIIHTVETGETVFGIATRYGVTVHDVEIANSLSDPTLIEAGQQLIIPGVEPPHLALDLPAPVNRFDLVPLILVEGQTARLRLSTDVPVTVTGTFLEHPLWIASELNDTLHTALIGIPIFTDPGIYPLSLTIVDSGGQQAILSANLQMILGGYGSESVNLLEDRSELLNTSVEDYEQSLIAEVMSTFNPNRYFNGPMGLPAAATMSSPFGTLRAYNGGSYDRFHSGADFAGVPGTPILAAAPGQVVLADTLNVRGVATILDHGWGVFSGYWHQTERYVQLGEFVTAGQIIGTMGATGRVSGPHLHWEVWVSGVPVDPMQWLRQAFP